MIWYLKVMKSFFSMRKLNFLLGIILMATVLTSCKKEVEITGISLDKSTLMLDVGEWQTLTATILPKNATDKSVIWLSHNGAIAAVVDGVVFGNMIGATTIIAKAGNHTATCEVIVMTPLEGTCWRGTYVGEGQTATLNFSSATNCSLSLSYGACTYNPGTYTFNYPNISLKLNDGAWNLSGTLIGNQITLSDGNNTVYLTKQ